MMTNVKNVMSSRMWNNMWFGGEYPVECGKIYAKFSYQFYFWFISWCN